MTVVTLILFPALRARRACARANAETSCTVTSVTREDIRGFEICLFDIAVEGIGTASVF